MSWQRITAAAILVTLSLVLQGGCVFEPREADGPPDGGQTDWETPINTDIVLRNLKAAFEGENITNYRNCFTEDYQFHVDPQDSLDAGEEGEERYADFYRDDEEQVASAIFGDASSSTVTFTTLLEPDETQTETYREEAYEVTIVWGSGAHINEEITYKGIARLHMRREVTGRWAIFRWVDRRPPGPLIHDTWGVLRGDYRS